MSITLAQVANGFVDKLDNITGLRAYAYVPEDINPPCVVVRPASIERGAMARGVMEINYELALFVSRASDRAAQANLHTYADPSGSVSNSVWAKLDADKTLGVTGVDAAVLRFRPFGWDEVAGYAYDGGIFDVLVLVTNP